MNLNLPKLLKEKSHMLLWWLATTLEKYSET